MIGTRPVIAATTFVLTAVALGPGAPRPELAIGAQRLLVERAQAADTALATVGSDLDAALDAGRHGAAAIVAGEEAPGPMLRQAADLAREAAGSAGDADAAVRALEGARLAADPDASPLPAGTSADTLASIAAQLSGVADAADEFAAMRRRATDVPVALDEALAAVGRGDLDAAASAVDRAHADHDAVAGWDSGLSTLPIWVDATNATIDAVERLLAALEAGDTAAAERASDDFAALADDAVRADRALQIAISEGGGTVAAAPLSRLVRERDALAAQRAAVDGLLVATGP